MGTFDTWKQGAKNGLPIFLGYIAVSFTFGIAARNIVSPLQAVLMSATNYTSAGQFAALGLIAASAPFWEVAAAQLVINLRYSLMSCCIAQKLGSGVPLYHRFLLAAGVTDEVFGVSVSVQGRLKPAYAYGVMSMALPGWVLGTFLGVAAAGVLPPRALSALGIAIYGMFIAIIFPPVKSNRTLAGVIAASMVCGTLCEHITLPEQITPGIRLIVLTLVLAGAAAVLFPIDKQEKRRATDGATHCGESTR